MICLLLINLVASAEWDNCKEVSEDKLKVKIKNNCLLGLDIPFVTNELATITLDTPLNNYVGGGYGKVAQFTVYTKEDYSNALRLLEFYDKKLAKEQNGDFLDYESNIIFDLKYYNGIKNITIPKYSVSCEDVQNVNGTIESVCEDVENGTMTYQEEDWLPLDDKDFKKGQNITVGIFTDVQAKDNYEWEGTFFGEKIDTSIWAEWTASLNVNLISYQKLDETSGTTTLDEIGHSVGTLNSDNWSVGLINNGQRFNGARVLDMSNNSNFNFSGKDFMIQIWFTWESWSGNYAGLLTKSDPTEANYDIEFARLTTNNLRYIVTKQAGGTAQIITSDVNTAGWKHMVFGYNGTGIVVYLNGVLNGYSPFVGGITGRDTLPLRIGSRPDQNKWDGMIDEVAMWDRALSESEITDLYNSGAGIQYTDSFSVPTTVTLIHPDNLTEIGNTPTKSYNLSCNASNDGGVVNLSLIINDTIIQTITNSTVGQNLTISGNRTFPSSVSNWTCLSSSLSDTVQAPANTINYTYRNIILNLSTPEENYVTNETTFSFSANVTNINLGIKNVSIVWDGVINQTNSSGLNNNYTFEITGISDGIHKWRYIAYDVNDQLYNSTTSRSYILSAINLTLINPVDVYNSTNFTVNFNCTSTSFTEGILNLTLNIDGSENFTVTNSTPMQNLSIDLSRTLSEGNHNWSCKSYSLQSLAISDTRTMTLDNTKPFINITSPEELISTLTDGETLNLNWTINDENTDSCWYIYPGSDNDGENVSLIFQGFVNIIDQVWNVSRSGLEYGYDVIIKTNESERRFLINGSATACFKENSGVRIQAGDVAYSLGCYDIDTDTLHIISLFNYVGTAFILENVTLASKINDVNCADNTTTFSYSEGYNNITMFANDTAGNYNSSTREFDSVINSFDLTYNNETFEGSQETFTANIIMGGNLSLSEATFNYNGTNYTTSIFFSDGNYTIVSSIIVPLITNPTNFSLFFYITADGITYSLPVFKQLVNNITLGECGAGDQLLLNMSLFNEELKTLITGDIEINAQALSKSNNLTTASVNASFSSVTTGSICLSPPEAFSLLYLDAEIRYTASQYLSLIHI